MNVEEINRAANAIHDAMSAEERQQHRDMMMAAEDVIKSHLQNMLTAAEAAELPTRPFMGMLLLHCSAAAHSIGLPESMVHLIVEQNYSRGGYKGKAE